MSRPHLIAAVRERMRSRSAVRGSEPPTPAPRIPSARPAPTAPDYELERLAAEARYHRERFELNRARVISASPRATSPGRLRELERTATAAQERLAHARVSRRGAA